MFAVLKAVTDPNPLRYTGTSCLTTGATATETERGPAAACAFCGFESPPLQLMNNAQTAAMVQTTARRRRPSAQLFIA
jgi:hypothetical protein